MSERSSPNAHSHDHVHGPDCRHDQHGGHGHEIEPVSTYRRDTPKLGRNDPCICGSGKKYKKCCGQG